MQWRIVFAELKQGVMMVSFILKIFLETLSDEKTETGKVSELMHSKYESEIWMTLHDLPIQKDIRTH